MEVRFDYNGETYTFDIRESATGRDVRRKAQEKVEGLIDGEYRFLGERTGNILEDEDLIKDFYDDIEITSLPHSESRSSQDVESLSEESVKGDDDEAKVKSDSSGGEGPKEDDKKQEEDDKKQEEAVDADAVVPAVVAELKEAIVKLGVGESPHQAKDGENPDDGEEAKIKTDSSEDTKKKVDLMMDIFCRCRTSKNVDEFFIRQELAHVMHMTEVPSGLKVPKDGGRIPRTKTLCLVVQEGFSVVLQSKRDGYWIAPFLAHDKLTYLRQRFAILTKCRPNDLILRKQGDEEVLKLDMDDISLDDLNITRDTILHATRRGSQEVKVVFNFSISVEMEIEFDKKLSKIARELVYRHAPDLSNVRFNFWYHGQIMKVDIMGDNIIGDEILGLHFLRVMLVIDPEVPITEDGRPHIRMCRIKRKLPKTEDVEKLVEKQSADSKRQGYLAALQVAQNRKKERGEEDSNRKPKDFHILRLEVSSRATRFFTLLVERDLVEDMDFTDDYPIPHEPPFTLQRISLSMTMSELRMRIFQECEEPPEHQTIKINNRLISSSEDHKTLRSLNLGSINSIYMEPSIMVRVLVEDNVLELKFPCRLTQFSAIHDEIEREFNIPKEDCLLEYKGVTAIPSSYLSEYRVKTDDEIRYVAPTILNLWHDVYLYQKNVWPHTIGHDIYQEISNETGIDMNDLIICSMDLTKVVSKRTKILEKEKCFNGAEFEIFKKDDYYKKKEEQNLDTEAPAYAQGQFLVHDPNGAAAADPRKIFGDKYLESREDPHKIFGDKYIESRASDDEDDDDSFKDAAETHARDDDDEDDDDDDDDYDD